MVLKEGSVHDGLPTLLGYKIGDSFGEILMTHGGQCLETWSMKMSNYQEKMAFAIKMLRQVLPGLRKIH